VHVGTRMNETSPVKGRFSRSSTMARAASDQGASANGNAQVIVNRDLPERSARTTMPVDATTRPADMRHGTGAVDS
jgi:hypothetical protein